MKKTNDFKYEKKRTSSGIEYIVFNDFPNIKAMYNVDEKVYNIYVKLTNSSLFSKSKWFPIRKDNNISNMEFCSENLVIDYVYELTKYYRKEQKSEKEKFFSLLKEPIENLTYTELMFCYTYKEAPYSTKLLLKQELNKRGFNNIKNT